MQRSGAVDGSSATMAARLRAAFRMISSLKTRLYNLLRSSERYTKTDMVYLASGGFWSTLAQVVTAITVLSFAMVVSRYLPKEVYGQYKYVLAVLSLIGTFSLNGLGTAIFQSAAHGYDGALREGFWTNIRWSVLVFLGALGVASYYFINGNDTLGLSFLIGGSFSPFLASANFAGGFLQAKKDFRRAAIYFSVIENLAAIGALIVTALLTNSVLALVAVYFLGNTLTTLWIYRRVTRLYKPDPSKTDPGTLAYGKHLSLMGILSGIAGNIDQVLLFHFVGPVQLATYNFAIAIPDQTKGPLKSLNAMLQAKFVGRSDYEIRASMRNKILWIAASTSVFVLLYYLFAPLIYSILFPTYAGAAFFSKIYAFALFNTVFAPASSYLLAKKKVYAQYTANILVAVFQIAIMTAGVLFFGLLGLIIARVVTKIGSGLFLQFLYYYSSSV